MTSPAYVSTRSTRSRVSFREALLSGIAEDGGLFIPASIPPIPQRLWEEASSFQELAANVLHVWLRDEIEVDALRELVHDALNFDVPLVNLDDAPGGEVGVLELFHGPTLSFKDFGARLMARLLSHFLRESHDELTILVATSGDTGSAVADGFAGVPNVRVVLLYPKGKVSPTQERQLIVRRPNVSALAVEGTFDDCQRMVKEAFADERLLRINLSSANSINIGRLLPQTLYYFEAARQGGLNQPVFCVPSGNLGNLTGGLLAQLAGLPAKHFVAAHNANDFFPRYLSGSSAEFGPSVATYSNAMDVGAPSNFERIRRLLPDEAMHSKIYAISVSDDETLVSIRSTFERYGYLADPHTAVGLHAVQRYRHSSGDRSPAVVLGTAHPAKFPDVMESAIGEKPTAPLRLARLWEQETRVINIPPTVAALANHLISLRDVAETH